MAKAGYLPLQHKVHYSKIADSWGYYSVPTEKVKHF